MKNLKSFHNKLFLYIAALIGLLLSILGCLAFVYVSNSINNDTLYSNEELTNSTSLNLDNLLYEMNKLALYASTNPEVRETLTTLSYRDGDTESTVSVYSTAVMEVLTSIIVPNSASGFRISILNESNFFETVGIPTSTSFLNSFLYTQNYIDWYNNLPIISNNESFAYETYDPWTNSNQDYVVTYREIFYQNSTTISVGTVMVQCPISYFNKLIDFEDKNIECFIFDENNALITSNTSTVENSAISTLTVDDLNAIFSSNSDFDYNYIYSTETLSNDWNLLIVQTQDVFTTVLFPIIVYLICGTLLLILITLLVVYFITDRTTKPLQQLITQVNDVSLNNLSINTNETSFDEFELLNNAFSEMFTRLRSSMDENEKRKTYELQANLIALQSQMDPHFLYNILTVIKSMNREENYIQVDYCCNYLAKMLRYLSTYNEGMVTLSQELEHAELYLNLMKFRYENQFNFYINIEDDMNTEVILINKLVIQPLLENCFQHGFKKVLPVWNIMINCYTLDDDWYISISDNGGGITPEQIEAIYNTVHTFVANPSDSISHLTLGGMGLVNTLSRLKLNQKNNISCTISHNYPIGTIITLKGELPNEYTCN